MAFQPVPDTVQINIIYTLNGVTVQNSLYAEHPGGYVLADLVAMAAQVDASVQGNFLALQPAEAVYVRTEVRGLAAPNDLTASDNTNAGPGVDPTAALPNNVTFALKKESGLTGRSARGRTYWIGIPRSKLETLDENQLIAAYVTSLVAAMEQMRIGINAVGTWTAVLVSRFEEGVERPFGITFPWVSTVAVDTRIDTQRGRLPS